MKRTYTSEDFLKVTVPAIYLFVAILAFYNISLHINHTGSGQPDIIMKKLGFFFSPGDGEGPATAAEETAVETATENTQEEQASESDEQDEGEAE